MDDLKTFAKDANQQEGILNTVKIFGMTSIWNLDLKNVQKLTLLEVN